MDNLSQIKSQLKDKCYNWLITGVAGFIGSNIAETLLGLDQNVRGIDNFSTGRRENLEAIKKTFGERRFSFVEGDLLDLSLLENLSDGVDFVSHQAALGSVPRSIDDPINTNNSNVSGFLNCLVAARDKNVKRVVYASSSSVYGDNELIPKKEDKTGQVLSPYALTKQVNESYARLFSRFYSMKICGLRYFNVFGPRQNPEGSYAAVIPRWLKAMKDNEPCVIFGDGSTSRDFSYVSNIVEANILAALSTNISDCFVCNVACGESTSLLDLYKKMRGAFREFGICVPENPVFNPPRPGDIKNSLADIGEAKRHLGYTPGTFIGEGLMKTVSWYVS